MKIVICVETNSSDSLVNTRFGRAEYLAVYDDKADQWDFIPNEQVLQAPQGAGIQTAQHVLDAQANVVLAINVGPKAMRILQGNGVDVYKAKVTTAKQALDDYKNDKLEKMSGANVEGHWV